MARRLAEHDRIGLVRLDQLGDAVEDRLQAQLQALARGGSPPPVVECPEAPVSFVDDAVPASSRSRIDADDLHTVTLRMKPDSPAPEGCSKLDRVPGDIWLTFPDGTEHELRDTLTIGRGPENDLALASNAVSRKHAALLFREGRWYVEDH